jgi:hypothetical protein
MEAEFRRIATKFLSEIVEKIDDLLGLARKLGAQLRVLSCDADGACINYNYAGLILKK